MADTVNSEITPLERAFAMEYVSNGYNHIKAAESIGLNRSKGIRLVKNPIVQLLIKELQDKQHTLSLVTNEFVMTCYMRLLPKLMGEDDIPQVVMNRDSGDTDTVDIKKFHAAETVAVLRDMAKMVGDYNIDGESKNFADRLIINLHPSSKNE